MGQNSDCIGGCDETRVVMRVPFSCDEDSGVRSCRSCGVGKDGADLPADVVEDLGEAVAQVHGRGGVDVDDRGDHAREGARVGGNDAGVVGEDAGQAVLQAS